MVISTAILAYIDLRNVIQYMIYIALEIMNANKRSVLSFPILIPMFHAIPFV